MMIEAGVRGDVDALEKKLLRQFCQLDDTVDLHFDPSVERRIKEMDCR